MPRTAQASKMHGHRRRLQTSKKIAEWKADSLKGPFHDTIFYPFSGPDMLNALAFFPEGKDFILFGLEIPGLVPDATKHDAAKRIAELRSMQTGLSAIIKFNFFMTNSMRVDLKNDSYGSIAGIIMFFLARSGYEVLDARNLSIDAQGTVVDTYNLNNKSLVPGVEFYFRKVGTSEVKRVRYFSLNVINEEISKHPNFSAYMSTQPQCTAIVKSASFIMHIEECFSDIRKLVMQKSDQILQDDSGVPLRFFLKGDWDVTYFGYYDKPIPLFSNRFQESLKKNMTQYSKGKLPFSYGYDYKPGFSNLIFAVKKSAVEK